MSKKLLWRGLIRRTNSGSAIYLHAQWETAQFFGWDVAFDADRPEVQLPYNGPPGWAYLRPPCTNRQGGLPMRICRSRSRMGHPAGKTHRFRIARAASYRDFAAVAKATKQEWFWMTDKNGHRIAREEWLALPSAYPSAP